MQTKHFCETEEIQTLAGFDFLDVCLLGETGTGKTYAARLLHELSPRKDKPFIAVNCAELSPSIVESELFGYEKGAFTGASFSKPGKFEAASGGTLFLDEIGELKDEVQAKLLKVVEEKHITRVGSCVPRPVNLRIIYATHRNLDGVREDLRYRIAAHTIELRPLRERPEEILPLARSFILEFSNKAGRKIVADDDSLQILKNAQWRGNVRELRSFIEKACLDALKVSAQKKWLKNSTSPAVLTSEILLSRLQKGNYLTKWQQRIGSDSSPTDYRQEIKDFDRQLIRQTLKKTAGNVSRAATELGLSRFGLLKKMKRYGISKTDH